MHALLAHMQEYKYGKDYKPGYEYYGEPDRYYGEPSYSYGKEYKPYEHPEG